MDVTGSTNSDLLENKSAVEGDWLVARRQDSGRGRQGRQWQGLDGNFFGSTLIELQQEDSKAATLSLVAGLALLDAVELVAPQADLQLKWPNDLMLGGAKLAGILLERSGSRVVAGFGVNLAEAPAIEGKRTAALADTARTTPQAFAPLLAGAFSRMLAAWRSSPTSAIVMAWMQRGHPIGTPITVHDEGGATREGVFAGLNDGGALMLETPTELLIVRAGDVSLANRPDGA
ncbi:biotin--[acetyl-CoA-carboxylase] ligase [Sphingomicrobium sp. XHP0235]|uniref:biotin--[acetyl-CoA-carboxylase] ligase n=1 Tax=Sphingomicrobium aquimarinum TaxID=3133971 RepID=UPI0031FE9887